MTGTCCRAWHQGLLNRIEATSRWAVPGCPLFAGHPVRLSSSVIVAANVDRFVIRQHETVVIVPIVTVPNFRDEVIDVPPKNTAVADPGETVIAADATCHVIGGLHGDNVVPLRAS
jgi:hypothetical protein